VADPRAALAAQNNADWYVMMWDLHGRRYIRNAEGFRAIDPPPAYHGWAGALHGADIATMIAPVLDQPGFAVKDASGTHDLTQLGLVTLFEATWLWHDGDAKADTRHWHRVTTIKALEEWETAWSASSPTRQKQFPADILQRPDVAIWGRHNRHGIDAGFIANQSKDCTGLSNLFGQNARPAATTICDAFGAGKPIVGYERGSDLAEAQATGWQDTGLLKIWHHQTSP